MCTVLDASAAFGRCNDIGCKSSESARKLAQVLTAGVNATRQPLNVFAIDQFFSWVAWIRKVASVDSINLHTIEETQSESFNASVWSACSGRCLFRTKTGLLGLGPAYIQIHDQLVVLCEAGSPCILRTAGYGEGAYHHFVGSCYVHGIMEGEAFHRYGESHNHHTFKLS